MTLPEICIRRPVFTTMLILFPLVVGVISYFKMGVDLFPNVDLPTGTEAPVVDKFDVDATPVLTLAVSSPRRMKELTEIADKQIKDALSSLDGVGQVILVGGTKRAVQVSVDTNKLEAYHLSVEQV